MNTPQTPPRKSQTRKWPFLLAGLGLLLGSAPVAATEPPSASPLVLPAWSLESVLDSVLGALSGDRLVQVAVIGMCLALFFITRGKWR